MNEVIKQLMQRKSVRSFTKQKISDKDKEDILLAAVNAPSAGNQQMYKIIDVIDKSILNKLSILCDNQPFINEGQMVLIFCADFRKWFDAFTYAGCKPRNVGIGDITLAIIDASIAAQNAVTAAESLGIGSCYIGDILENNEKIKELLNIPKYVIPAVMLVFGYPNESIKNQRKPNRESLSHLVCKDTYHTSNKEELENMFMEKQNMNIQEYDQWIKAFCNRKYMSDFSLEMSRSVNKYFDEYK